MSGKGVWTFRLIVKGIKSRAANRRSLEILGEFFAKALTPEAIMSHFGLTNEDLTPLLALGRLKDGFWPVRALDSSVSPEALAKILVKLATYGFILVKPWRRLIRLSDAGRFLLILVVRDL
ncbi:MAG: hypothetical protein LBS60_04285 [Deltaproteobacteria bacterium]|jgi:hypothetical protein|nr:hypothetical protein [Deltaproteobacteria bacterium]